MASNTSSSSSTLKSVWLHKWWLVKADKGGLAVSGLVSGKSKVARIFCSDAIAKRHNRATLETADGYLITISDSIDRSHSLENGFSPEVCNQFLFGFPYDWEDFAKCYYSIGESATKAAGPEISCLVYKSVDSFKELSPGSLDDLPATRIRDLVLSPNHVVRKRVLDEALGRHCNQDTKILATMKSKNSVTDNGVFSKGTPRKKKNKAQQTWGDVGVMYESNVTETFATTRWMMDIDVSTPRSGISTGQSIKLKRSTHKMSVNSSPNNCVLTSSKLVATRHSARLNKSMNEVETILLNSSEKQDSNGLSLSTDATVNTHVRIEPKEGIATKSSIGLNKKTNELVNKSSVSSIEQESNSQFSPSKVSANNSKGPKKQLQKESIATRSSVGLKKTTNKLVNNSSVSSIKQESKNQFSPSKVSSSSSIGRRVTRSLKKQFEG